MKPDKMNRYTEAFCRAQKELNQDGFVLWLCQAYGALTTNDRGKGALLNIRVINKAIDSLSKEYGRSP